MAKVPIYLIRHCDAESREYWRGPDAARPLTGKGIRQARAVADRFATGPLASRQRVFDVPALEPRPTRLVSSPAERCVETLHPLAGACGLPIGRADFLAEGADAKMAFGLLAGMALTDPGILVACTHGDVVWGVLAELETAGVVLEGPDDAKKGSIWVLEVEGTTPVAARYLAPVKV